MRAWRGGRVACAHGAHSNEGSATAPPRPAAPPPRRVATPPPRHWSGERYEFQRSLANLEGLYFALMKMRRRSAAHFFDGSDASVTLVTQFVNELYDGALEPLYKMFPCVIGRFEPTTSEARMR